jgi:ribosomal protein S18 acetylase RimI-like enzyme
MSRLGKYWLDLRTLPADAARAYRIDGLRGAWKALASRTLHRVFRAGRLIVFAHRLGDDRDSPLPAGVRITLATPEEMGALVPLAGEREASRFRVLQQNGHHCLIAWRGDQPVGYAWVAHRVGPDVAMWPLPFDFAPGAAYLWNLYVLPSERAHGIGSALARARLSLARKQGFREGWRMVAPSNAASLRTLRKSTNDTRVVGEIRFVQLVSRTYARFAPQTPPTRNSFPASDRN